MHNQRNQYAKQIQNNIYKKEKLNLVSYMTYIQAICHYPADRSYLHPNQMVLSFDYINQKLKKYTKPLTEVVVNQDDGHGTIAVHWVLWVFF